jgi:hypothetical protein
VVGFNFGIQVKNFRCLMFGCSVAGALSPNGNQVFMGMNEEWVKPE